MSEALNSGALGVMLRGESIERLFQAMIDVALGVPHLSPAATAIVARGLAGNTMAKPPQNETKLSPREREIFRLLAAGVASGEIAQKLGLSMKTIQTHFCRMKEKLHAKTHAELSRKAILTGAARNGKGRR